MIFLQRRGREIVSAWNTLFLTNNTVTEDNWTVLDCADNKIISVVKKHLCWLPQLKTTNLFTLYAS